MQGIDKPNVLTSTREFEKLFKAQYKLLTYHAVKYVKDINLAEEIVQEVFVKVWEKRDEILITGSAQGYLATSVKNTCLNYIKHQKIVVAHERSAIASFMIDPSQHEEEMVDMEIEAAIISAMEKLPPQRKKIFMMSRLDGLKYQEIADKMGLSIKTIEVQMGQALKQLRIVLKEYIAIFVGLIINLLL